nr:RluA family pseudouridine synthase [Metabacillus litoralis]
MKRNGEWLEIMIPTEWANQTVFHTLTTHLGVSKATIQKWNSASAIKRNNEKADVNHKVQPGDCLSLHLFKEEGYGVLPEKKTLSILYEDDHLLIVNKPAGIDTHPNQENQLGTLANVVAYHYQQHNIHIRVRHIHRLDKDTSGAIIFAKHDLSHSLLDQALQAKKIKRTYIALAEGNVSPSKGTIKKAIGKDRHHATRRRVSPNGQQAITHYQVEEYKPKTNLSTISLQLETGRTHQIRVHLSFIGHPLAGDLLYGGKTNIMKRQALHSAKVSLTHPLSNEKLTVEAPLPKDMLILM